MKTQIITVNRHAPSGPIEHQGYVMRITLPAPPFDVPSDRDIATLRREEDASKRQMQARP